MTAQYPQYPQPQPQPYPPGQIYGPPSNVQYAAVPAAPAPPVQAPLAQGTIDEYFQQPSAGGGPSLKFPAIGTRYRLRVARQVTNADIQQQTNIQGVPQTYKDGRPKFVMKVPVLIAPSPAFPEGTAQWFVKGQARDELVRAMTEAGAPEGPPENGAEIDVAYVSDRPAGPGFNPAKQFQITYTRPTGVGPAASHVAGNPPQVEPAPLPTAPVPAPQQQVAQPQQPVAPPPPAMPQAPAQPAPQQGPPPPPGMTPEQQQILANVAGQAPVQPTG